MRLKVVPDRDPALLLDCLKCGECCHGPSFGDLTVVLRPEEIAQYPPDDVVQGSDGLWYIRSVEERCLYYDRTTRTCGVYETRPFCCRMYPLAIIGNNVVAQTECNDFDYFLQQFKAGDPRAVEFVAKAIAGLNECPSEYLWMLRGESGYTDNLFVLGRINDPTVE